MVGLSKAVGSDAEGQVQTSGMHGEGKRSGQCAQWWAGEEVMAKGGRFYESRLGKWGA